LNREIICEVYPWESRIAIVENGRLAEVFWANKNENVGNIYKGKVKDIILGLSCVFVDIGLSKNAFLFAGDISCPLNKKGINTLDLLKNGQDIMVQVKKEAFSEKGARVTGNITIPGHYLVLLPFQQEVSISRKITGSHVRQHLKELIEANKPESIGAIIRTACLDAEDQDVIDELAKLLQVWDEIKKNYQEVRAPNLIYEDMDALGRTLRDYLDIPVSRVVVNNPRLRDKIIRYLDGVGVQRSFSVEFEVGELFEKYALEKDIRRALRRKVWLKNGGYLIFDQTEAMTIIDVNSGKYTGKNDFEDTIYKINIEAATEIPRQLRLRSIGGIVLIDFIDMKDKNNEENIIETFRKELEKDKAHTRIMGITGLGFLEMTRKKSRYGVADFFTQECSHCNGRGRSISFYAMACEIKRKIANLGYLESNKLLCEVNPKLLPYVIDNDRSLSYLERRSGKIIKVISNENLREYEYNINPVSD